MDGEASGLDVGVRPRRNPSGVGEVLLSSWDRLQGAAGACGAEFGADPFNEGARHKAEGAAA